MKPTVIHTNSEEVKTTSDRINLVRQAEPNPGEGLTVELNTFVGKFYYIFISGSWQPTEN